MLEWFLQRCQKKKLKGKFLFFSIHEVNITYLEKRKKVEGIGLSLGGSLYGIIVCVREGSSDL